MNRTPVPAIPEVIRRTTKVKNSTPVRTCLISYQYQRKHYLPAPVRHIVALKEVLVVEIDFMVSYSDHVWHHSSKRLDLSVIEVEDVTVIHGVSCSSTIRCLEA